MKLDLKNASLAIFGYLYFNTILRHRTKTKYYHLYVNKNSTWIIQCGDQPFDVRANYKAFWCHVRYSMYNPNEIKLAWRNCPSKSTKLPPKHNIQIRKLFLCNFA